VSGHACAPLARVAANARAWMHGPDDPEPVMFRHGRHHMPAPLARVAANARAWMHGPDDPEPVVCRHGWRSASALALALAFRSREFSMRSSFHLVAFFLFFAVASVNAKDATIILDSFDNPEKWHVIASTQVSGSIRALNDENGRSLCLDYNFNGVSGYVGIQHDLVIEYPDNYRFDFKLRGESPDNDLQFKLIDASGDNVWWVNRPKYRYPGDWTPVRYKRRHVGKAWGPSRLLKYLLFQSHLLSLRSLNPCISSC
jgi:hypothetical protein